jgi:hypothetical protein
METREGRQQLLDHMDARFDKLEDKLDVYAIKTVENSQKIVALQGSSKLIITVLLACAGFLAAGYFSFLQGIKP